MQKKILFITVINTVLLFGLYIGYSIGSKCKNANSDYQKGTKVIVSPVPTKKIEEGLIYSNLELELINNQNKIVSPTSLLFGIKINNFHLDWKCSSSIYNNNGFEVVCEQRLCSAWNQIERPTRPNRIQQQNCYEEYAGREYSQSLKTLTIKATEYKTNSEITDFTKIIDPKKLKTTVKGINYEFNKTNTGKYSNYYTAVFYSPFELTEKLSKMVGEFYGSDLIYGKYTIETRVSGDNMTDDQVMKLFEKIIDSVTFIKTD